MSTKKCPICDEQTHLSERYPHSVCSECSGKTFNENNEKIEFYNIDIYGGFYSIINGERSEEDKCYINGIKCHAQEARFGGIVVSVDEN